MLLSDVQGWPLWNSVQRLVTLQRYNMGRHLSSEAGQATCGEQLLVLEALAMIAMLQPWGFTNRSVLEEFQFCMRVPQATGMV
jgi:hypothetical protein